MQSISRVPQSQIAWPTEPTQSVHSSLSTEPFHILRAHLKLSRKTKPFLNSLLVESPNRLTADCITLLSLSFSRTSLAYSMLSFCTASLEDFVSSHVTFHITVSPVRLHQDCGDPLIPVLAIQVSLGQGPLQASHLDSVVTI